MAVELWIASGIAAASVGTCLWMLHRQRDLHDRLRETSLRLAEIRTQRHLALVEEQSKQQALLDSMVEGVLLLDEQGKVEHVNPALVRLFNLEKDIRGIPLAWRLIDCSFGVIGAIPLLIALRKTTLLEKSTR